MNRKFDERRNLPVAGPYVHLGDRLHAIDRIRSGTISAEGAAQSLGVTHGDILHWQEAHGADRTVFFAELRGGSPQARRLSERAQRLAGLVADAERELRDLNQELIRTTMASATLDRAAPKSSKKFA